MAQNRHTAEEIAAKLEQADAMRAQGKSQTEIARFLGVSVMTYHRWRKARCRTPGESSLRSFPAGDVTTIKPSTARLDDLERENVRLRRLVTDLLLQKLELEETLAIWRRSA